MPDMNNGVAASALVTGAATGIGLKIVQDLVARGYQVIAVTPPWEDEAALSRVANTHILRLDLERSDIKDAVSEFLAGKGCKPKVLINNAAVFERRSVPDVDLELLNRTFHINTFVPLLLSQLFVECRDNGSEHGYIINIASDAAVNGSKNGAHYSASKGALISLTRSLSRAYGPQGILVNAIAPGMTRTRQSARPEPEYEKVAGQTALGRIAEPADISRAVCGLISGDFDYMTGAVINLTGGRFCW